MSITWSDAFRGSMLYCVYSCMWIIIGGIVLGVGVMVGVMIGYSAFSSGGSFEGTLFGIFILLGAYFAGIAICALGSAASMIKVAGDTASKSRMPRTSQYETRRF
ncbi:MAG: hypothetical protein ACFFC6_07065 [Promethearchaeota archaeon]